MKETTSDDPAQRTRYNVRDSDGTVVFSRGDVSGGTKWTMDVAGTLGKPMLHLDLGARSARTAAHRLLAWVEAEGIEVLNVAGPRESEAPGIHGAVRSVLGIALRAAPDDTRRGRRRGTASPPSSNREPPT